MNEPSLQNCRTLDSVDLCTGVHLVTCLHGSAGVGRVSRRSLTLPFSAEQPTLGANRRRPALAADLRIQTDRSTGYCTPYVPHDMYSATCPLPDHAASGPLDLALPLVAPPAIIAQAVRVERASDRRGGADRCCVTAHALTHMARLSSIAFLSSGAARLWRTIYEPPRSSRTDNLSGGPARWRRAAHLLLTAERERTGALRLAR